MTSECSTCPVPGNCCRAIVLGGGLFLSYADTIEDVEECIELLNVDERHRLATGDPEINGVLPFRPLFKTQEGSWIFWCPNLSLETGRCTDYVNRPVACRDYKPGTDTICVLFDIDNHEHDWKFYDNGVDICTKCGKTRREA